MSNMTEPPFRSLPKWPLGLFWLFIALATIAFVILTSSNGPADMAGWPAQQVIFLELNKALAALPTMFWSATTLLGDTTVLMLLLSLFLFRRPQVWAAALAAVPLGGLFSVLVKHWAAVPRPAAVLDHSIFNLIGPALYGNSFPSGHTVTAFAAFAAVGMTLATAQAWGRPLKWFFLSVGFVLASMVGLSRIAIGAHWPIDIFAGAAGGWVAGLSGFAIARHTAWWQWLFFGPGRRSSAIGIISWGLLLWARPHGSLACAAVLAISGLCGIGVGLRLLLLDTKAATRLAVSPHTFVKS